MSLAPQMLDLVEELRLRRWARENYVESEARLAEWHEVILDEMTRRDLERQLESPCRRSGIVPLLPFNYAENRPHSLRGPSQFGEAHDVASPHFA